MTGRRLKARKVFLSLSDRITDLINEGHTVKGAYNSLSDEGLFEYSFYTFKRYYYEAKKQGNFSSPPSQHKHHENTQTVLRSVTNLEQKATDLTQDPNYQEELGRAAFRAARGE